MHLKFWGVRGSIPHSMDTMAWVQHFELLMRRFFSEGHKTESSINDYISSLSRQQIGGYGTATTCVEVTDDKNQSLIVDGGSGIKSISDRLQALNWPNARKEFHILLTHFHLDHILGLPFFVPHFMPGFTINYYSVQSETESIVRSLFKKPTFPISYANLQAQINFHKLAPYVENKIGGMFVTPYRTDHPDVCYGFKIKADGKTYAHAVDNEAVRLTKEQLGQDAGLYEGADLLFFDAQYEESSMSDKKGWGHGTSHRGFEICSNFHIQQVLFAHHDPAFSIADSVAQEQKTAKLFSERYQKLKTVWRYAHDGYEVTL